MRYFFVIGLCVATLIVASCTQTNGPSDSIPTVEQQLIASRVQDGITVELYADHALTTGFNNLSVRLVKDSKVIEDAHVHLYCDMDMGEYHHGAPAIQPDDEPDAKGLWNCSAVFTMPSVSQWSVVVSIHDHETDAEVDVRIPVSVIESNTTQIASSPMFGNILFVIDQTTWHTGLNTFNLLMFATADSVSYTPIENAVVTVNPTMPSMGHGSSGNRNPSDSGDGWYTTTVNLIMSGDWDIAFTMNDDDGKSTTVHFPIVVP